MQETSGTSDERPFSVVGIGASAGGAVALQQLFASLSADTGMSFVVALPLSADRESEMASLLRGRTPMPVAQVRPAARLEPDHVYILPPDCTLTSVQGRLDLVPHAAADRDRAPIDLVFRALADTHGARSVGVVLSGSGTDGARGLRRIKEAGGIVLVQQPDEAEHPGMPLAAIATGIVDRVLPTAALGPELLRLRRAEVPFVFPEPVRSPAEDGSQVRAVLGEMGRRTGRDFREYRQTTMLRRLRRRMQVIGASDLERYARVLRADPAEALALDRDLLLPVTSFFRDSDAFAALERDVLPEIFRDRTQEEGVVRVWDAGCASGEEAYSIAMLLQEQSGRFEPPPPFQVFATEADEAAVRVAREGVYPYGIVAEVSEERLAKHFSKHVGGYLVGKHVRDRVLFASHDLLHDPPFSTLDLVVCRNVLVHLERDVQRRVLETFHHALRSGGHLFLGASESVEPADDLFHVVDEAHRIFRRRPVSPAAVPNLPSWPLRRGDFPDDLETSNEELESDNDELRTLNQKYRLKIGEMAQLNADLRNLINSTAATIFLTRDLAIRLYTPTVTDLFDFKETDIGRPIGDATHRLVYPELVVDAERVLANGGPVEREVSSDDGRWFMVRGAPYRSLEDRIEGVVLTLVDVTERKQSEIEREGLLRDAKEGSAAKSNFLNAISHDFRTPLNGVIGYADLLVAGVSGDLNTAQLHHVRRIKAGASQILTMVEEILDYARIENERVVLNIGIVDPHVVCEDSLDMVRPQADAKEIDLGAEYPARLPPMRTDASKVRQILTNLLGNAVKFTDAGRVTLRVRASLADIEFSVEDTGLGIAAKHLELVFDRFWQIETGGSRSRGGSGLGLTVGREFARLLGGELSVESTLGQGSRFVLRLPLVAPDEDRARPEPG